MTSFDYGQLMDDAIAGLNQQVAKIEQIKSVVDQNSRLKKEK